MLGIMMSEGAREQCSKRELLGKQFQFLELQKQESKVKEMDRTYSEMMGAEQDRAQAKADQTGAITGMFGSMASIGGGMLG